jgi:hypothetical protein
MMIYYDEYTTMPDWKWYRNPVKWWRWRQILKRIEKAIAKGKKDGTIWMSSTRS